MDIAPAAPFIPWSTYAGSRRGYFFGTGDRGTGYYLDSAAAATWISGGRAAQSGEDLLLPAEVLDASPSARDGVDGDTETRHRVFGCELISEVGILLKL